MYELRHLSFDEEMARDFLQVINNIEVEKAGLSEIADIIDELWQIPFFISRWRTSLSDSIESSATYGQFFIEVHRVISSKIEQLLGKLRV